MPQAPKRRCAAPCCPKFQVKDNRCEDHQRERTPRAKEHLALYGRQWKAYRLGFLAEHPMCCDPFERHPGELVPSAVVDHIKAHRGDPTLFWDPSNHRALCTSFNSYACAKHQGGFGNTRR